MFHFYSYLLSVCRSIDDVRATFDVPQAGKLHGYEATKRIESEIPLQSHAGLAQRDFGNGYVQLHLNGAGFSEAGSDAE